MRPRQPDVLGHCSWQLCPKWPSLQAGKRPCGVEVSVGPRVRTYLVLSHPSSSIPMIQGSFFPQPGILSYLGPSSPSSLPFSQRVPVNPGGHTHSPSWSWQTPPCRQPGHSLVQPGPQRPGPQPGGMCFQQLTLTHLTTAAEGWGSPGDPQEVPTGLPTSQASPTPAPSP